jgi:V/A-type H+/Na+-transporting ATPase subunit C
MPSDYGYINARIKGWHSRLLTAGAFAEILDLPDFPAFAKWMESGPYAADWQLARARYDGLEAVEQALEGNFGELTGQLLKISEGGPRRLIEVLLRRWDLANLKTVARGIAQEWSGPEIVRSLWPAGTLDLVRLKELADQRTLRGLADVLATWKDPSAAPLSGCLSAFERDKDLVPVELALDRSYYREAFRRLRGAGSNKGLLRDLLRREVDLANTKMVKRMAGRPGGAAADHRAYVIDGGLALTAAAVADLLDGRRRGSRLRTLRGTAWHAYLAGDGDPVELENTLDRSFWSGCARLYRARPLAIDVAVGFLWQKYFELVNLRMLARAKYYGLPADQVRGHLFLN